MKNTITLNKVQDGSKQQSSATPSIPKEVYSAVGGAGRRSAAGRDNGPLCGTFTQVGMPVGFQLNISNIGLAASRVNYNASLIGGIPQTQEIVDYCAQNKIYPQIELIDAGQINEAWTKVLNKEARYRYVIDAATI